LRNDQYGAIQGSSSPVEISFLIVMEALDCRFMNRISFLAWTGSLLVCLVSNQLPAAEWHVAAYGNDAHPGSAREPFATLARAQLAARTVARQEPVTVTIHGGIYYLPATLTFTAADSGTAKAPVVYRAAPGEIVILSGGRKLELAWEPHRGGVQKARLPEGFTTDQLFVNGERQILARYPNFDPAIRIFNGYARDAIDPERVARWSDPSGGFIHAMHNALWGGMHYVITGKDAAGQLLYTGGWQNNRPAGLHRDYRFVENIFEELDAPGEWFIDTKSSILYFYPPAGLELAKATVEAVRLRHLVEFQGPAQAPVKFVTLRGLIFRHAARTFMETKEPLLRSDWTIYRGGAVFFNGSEDCALVDNTLDQLGGNAVFVNNYNRRLTIRGCHIARAGGNGIAFVGNPAATRNGITWKEKNSFATLDRTPGPQSADYPADCRVEDCLIHETGRVEKQTAPVQIAMAQGITVRHCSLYDVPRAGINIGDGCWGGHVIEFCDIFDTVKETGDHGSFNSWGRDRFWGLKDAPAGDLPALALLDVVKPVILRNNRWRCDHGWDVDLDDGSSHYEIYNNLLLRGGLKLREGFHRHVWNNIVVNNTFHPHVWFEASGDVVTNNIFMGAYRPAAMNNSLAKWGQEVDRNLFTSSDADRVKFAAKGCDAHSLVGDPQFVDPAHGDFRVRDGSPALQLGFRNFPMDQFGVRQPTLAALARRPEIPVLNLGAALSAAAENVVRWKGASLKTLAGEEFSALGVSRETRGVLVFDAPNNSLAARQGLSVNDLIQSVNGTTVRTAEEFQGAVRQTPAGTTIKLGLLRNAKSLSLELENTP
jgi:hypothetical protein